MAKSFSVLTAIPGFGGRYTITPDGRIWSTKRPGSGSHRTGRWLTPVVTKDGYLRVTLSTDSKLKGFLVHRLVARTYIPNPKKLGVVNHLDNNPKNNHFLNLEWCSQGDNVRYAVQQGRHIGGERVHTAKLTREQATEIKQYPGSSDVAMYLSERFSISRSQVWAIRAGRSWASL